jgi:hypothetical protein
MIQIAENARKKNTNMDKMGIDDLRGSKHVNIAIANI